MPKKSIFDNDEYMISETGNWNVAADYSKFMIMQSLNLCYKYYLISLHGYVDLIEELQYGNYNIDFLKMKGFNRLVNELIALITNTKFAVAKSKGREKLETIRKDLIRINKLQSLIVRTNLHSLTLIFSEFR